MPASRGCRYISQHFILVLSFHYHLTCLLTHFTPSSSPLLSYTPLCLTILSPRPGQRVLVPRWAIYELGATPQDRWWIDRRIGVTETQTATVWQLETRRRSSPPDRVRHDTQNRDPKIRSAEVAELIRAAFDAEVMNQQRFKSVYRPLLPSPRDLPGAGVTLQEGRRHTSYRKKEDVTRERVLKLVVHKCIELKEKL